MCAAWLFVIAGMLGRLDGRSAAKGEGERMMGYGAEDWIGAWEIGRFCEVCREACSFSFLFFERIEIV